jgi:hypothetical protein
LRIFPNEKRAGMMLHERCEGGIDLGFGSGLQDMELHPLHTRRFLHVSHHALDIRTVGIHNQGDHPAWGTSSDSS